MGQHNNKKSIFFFWRKKKMPQEKKSVQKHIKAEPQDLTIASFWHQQLMNITDDSQLKK